MKASNSWLAIPVSVLIAACGGGEAGEGELAEVETPPPAAEIPPTTPPAGGMAMTAPMQPVENSGISGEAAITDRGQQTEVMVRLTGAPPSGSHPGHVHSGTCAAIGSVVQPLQPITVDATGAGTATSTVDIPAATAMNGQHVVVYHGAGGTPASCAAIPSHAM